MPQSYKAIYDHGQIRWLTDKPPVEESRVIITLLPQPAARVPSSFRAPSPRLAGKGKILGDIVAPVVPKRDWEALR